MARPAHPQIPTSVPSGAGDVAVPPHERNLAAVMHIGSIFLPMVAPIAGLAIGKKHSFLGAHSWMALRDTLLLQAGMLIVGLISLTHTLVTLYGFWERNWEGFSIWPFLLKIAIGWIVFFLIQIVLAIVSMRQAMLAWQGRWPGRKGRAGNAA